MLKAKAKTLSLYIEVKVLFLKPAISPKGPTRPKGLEVTKSIVLISFRATVFSGSLLLRLLSVCFFWGAPPHKYCSSAQHNTQ